VPIDPALDRDLYDELRSRGEFAALTLAESRLGFRPSPSQLAIAVGRHAWLTGDTHTGDQSYQRRMTAAGRRMSQWANVLGYDPVFPGTPPAPTARTTRPLPSRATTGVTTRVFGVELEFNRGGSYSAYGREAQREAIVTRMIAAGHDAYNEGGWVRHFRTPTRWRMQTDGTVTGGEFVSPLLSGEAGLAAMREGVRAIKDEGGTAGRSQGLHVHHDVRDFDLDDMTRLVRNLKHCERAVLSYVPRYRYDGSGTHRGRAIGQTGWAAYERLAASGQLMPGNRGEAAGHPHHRYVAFNMNPVMAQGSVEWRCLGNTLNPVKIRTWVLMGSAIHAFTKAGHEFGRVVDAEEMTDVLVAEGFLPAAEGRRFLAVCNDRLTGRAAA
jgi:hypothetical protein